MQSTAEHTRRRVVKVYKSRSRKKRRAYSADHPVTHNTLGQAKQRRRWGQQSETKNNNNINGK